MDVSEAIDTRLEIREYVDRPVDDDLKRTILEAGRTAPSGKNLQHWRFVLVDDDEQLAALAERSSTGGWVGGADFAVAVCTDPSYAYHEIDAGNISRAETEGEGAEMTRRCWGDAGNGWAETCRQWDEGEAHAFEVHTETSGSRLHGLFATFVGSFGVDDDGATTVWAAFELEPKYGPLGRGLLFAMRPHFRRGMGDLLDTWAGEIEARGSQPTPDEAAA